MKQLRENWRSGGKDMALAKTMTRVPLLKLVDFEKKHDAAWLAEISCNVEFVEEDAKEENASRIMNSLCCKRYTETIIARPWSRGGQLFLRKKV